MEVVDYFARYHIIAQMNVPQSLKKSRGVNPGNLRSKELVFIIAKWQKKPEQKSALQTTADLIPQFEEDYRIYAGALNVLKIRLEKHQNQDILDLFEELAPVFFHRFLREHMKRGLKIQRQQRLLK